MSGRELTEIPVMLPADSVLVPIKQRTISLLDINGATIRILVEGVDPDFEEQWSKYFGR